MDAAMEMGLATEMEMLPDLATETEPQHWGKETGLQGLVSLPGTETGTGKVLETAPSGGKSWQASVCSSYSLHSHS